MTAEVRPDTDCHTSLDDLQASDRCEQYTAHYAQLGPLVSYPCATLFHQLFVSCIHSFLTYTIHHLVYGAHYHLGCWFLCEIVQMARDTSDPY